MPCFIEVIRKTLEAKARNLGHQLLAVAEMTIGRRGADACGTGGLGNREAGRSLLTDKAQRALDERLSQIAMMISATPRAAMLPIHVKKIYMAGLF